MENNSASVAAKKLQTEDDIITFKCKRKALRIVLMLISNQQKELKKIPEGTSHYGKSINYDATLEVMKREFAKFI